MGQRRRATTYSESYIQIIIELQQNSMLDESTALLIKKLILEENVDVQRVLKQYNTRVISDQ